jgi:phosphoribosylformylglycinamidine synthase
VPREDDVKFLGLCEGRDYPVLRIGVTDATAPVLEIQDYFTVPLTELQSRHRSTLPNAFA